MSGRGLQVHLTLIKTGKQSSSWRCNELISDIYHDQRTVNLHQKLTFIFTFSRDSERTYIELGHGEVWKANGGKSGKNYSNNLRYPDIRNHLKLGPAVSGGLWSSPINIAYEFVGAESQA